MKTEEWQEKAIFIDKLRELTDRLNRCRAAYEAHTPLVRQTAIACWTMPRYRVFWSSKSVGYRRDCSKTFSL